MQGHSGSIAAPTQASQPQTTMHHPTTTPAATPVSHSVGLQFRYGALDSHPSLPSHVASGRCVLSAAADGAPAGVVCAFAEPTPTPPPRPAPQEATQLCVEHVIAITPPAAPTPQARVRRSRRESASKTPTNRPPPPPASALGPLGTILVPGPHASHSNSNADRTNGPRRSRGPAEAHADDRPVVSGKRGHTRRERYIIGADGALTPGLKRGMPMDTDTVAHDWAQAPQRDDTWTTGAEIENNGRPRKIEGNIFFFFFLGSAQDALA